MTAEAPVTGWADPVAAFLRANIPRETETPAGDSRLGWNHMFSTAYQIGCMALIALGEATEEVWGAAPRTPPVRPDVRPRWDDVAVAVLWLAEQQNTLQWRLPDGSVRPQRTGQFVVRVINAPRPPPPNIAAAHHCHPARASVEVMEVLSALGLINEGVWTKAAELVLWRCGASASAATVETDRRFTAAIKTCIATMPADVRADLSGLTIIAHTDLASEPGRWQAHWPTWQPAIRAIPRMLTPQTKASAVNWPPAAQTKPTGCSSAAGACPTAGYPHQTPPGRWRFSTTRLPSPCAAQSSNGCSPVPALPSPTRLQRS
jgi:hypothetical protein